MKTKTQPTLLSLPQVAERLGISRQAVHQAVVEGRLRAREMNLGGRKFFLVTLQNLGSAWWVSTGEVSTMVSRRLKENSCSCVADGAIYRTLVQGV